jgi:glycosyltransferase A (GT-A) superfamily protein (DUF2064 family)
MTTITVLAEPPAAGSLPELVPDPLSGEEAADLYGAMLADVCETVQRGDGDLLVNYGESPAADDPEAALREHLAEELPEPEAARYEPQVGETKAGRVGNALTHLLETEGEESVAVAEPTAPFLRREHVGTAAMKLRTSEVVLGPAAGGRVAFAGFTEPIDFADAYATPAIETLTERAVDAGLDVGFLPMMPLVERPSNLATAVAVSNARQRADRLAPTRTAARIAEFGLSVDSEGSIERN